MKTIRTRLNIAILKFEQERKKKVSSCKDPLLSAVTESCEIAMLRGEDETNVSGFF